MNGKGKKREKCDQISDVHNSTPQKFPKKEFESDDDDPNTIFVCEISNKTRVFVKKWKGKIMVDIREFYVKDDKKLHGKKGISLTMSQWRILRENLEEIDLAFEENS